MRMEPTPAPPVDLILAVSGSDIIEKDKLLDKINKLIVHNL